MKHVLIVLFAALAISCKAGKESKIQMTGLDTGGCRTLTGTFKVALGTEELRQTGCEMPVTVRATLVQNDGAKVTRKFLLDGVRKLENGATPSHYRYFTRTWRNDIWTEKWERYENGTLVNVSSARYFIDNNGNHVYEELGTSPRRIVSQRIK
ncbi:MAG TPA: hypothetical protein VFV50_00345 [Bdellovibrionales bacterium]|nr:hypothetical protein [Bdellovibrionales bacterium]